MTKENIIQTPKLYVRLEGSDKKMFHYVNSEIFEIKQYLLVPKDMYDERIREIKETNTN